MLGLGPILELLISLSGLVTAIYNLYLSKTNHITHHGRTLHITPKAPLLSYALERSSAPLSSFNRTYKDGCCPPNTITENLCTGGVMAYITDGDCLSKGCVDTVWIWEGVPAYQVVEGVEKWNFHSKETLRLFDVYEKVTGEKIDSMQWERCASTGTSTTTTGDEADKIRTIREEL
jgi:hypothetical protein